MLGTTRIRILVRGGLFVGTSAFKLKFLQIFNVSSLLPFLSCNWLPFRPRRPHSWVRVLRGLKVLLIGLQRIICRVILDKIVVHHIAIALVAMAIDLSFSMRFVVARISTRWAHAVTIIPFCLL